MDMLTSIVCEGETLSVTVGVDESVTLLLDVNASDSEYVSLRVTFFVILYRVLLDNPDKEAVMDEESVTLLETSAEVVIDELGVMVSDGDRVKDFVVESSSESDLDRLTAAVALFLLGLVEPDRLSDVVGDRDMVLDTEMVLVSSVVGESLTLTDKLGVPDSEPVTSWEGVRVRLGDGESDGSLLSVALSVGVVEG